MVDQSLTDRLVAVPGVAAAEPQVVGYGTLLGKDGKGIGGNGPPRQAGSWINDSRLNPYQLAEGRAPAAPDEVVVNRGAADAGHLAVGDITIVQTPEPVQVRIVGLASFGGADGLGKVTWTAFTLEGAQANVTHRSGQVTSILVKAAPGVSSDELRARIAAVVPPGVQAITGHQLAQERMDDISRVFLTMLRTFLVVFAGVALAVATLSIANTFSITLAQRTRELALLRAIGAGRAQLRRSVTVEALLIGGVAAAAGLIGGLAVAGLLKGLFDAAGGALPAGGLTIRASSLAISFAVGVIVTVLAAQAPARRAGRVAPVAAMAGIGEEASRPGRRSLAGAVLLSAGLGLGIVAVVQGSFLAAGLASAMSAGGSLLVAPLLVPAVARVFTAVMPGRLAGRLAERNARRNPRRTAATSTALVVGVAVVTLITVVAGSLRSSLRNDLSGDFRADVAINTAAFGGNRLSPRVLDELGRVPQVGQAVPLGGGPVLLDGRTTEVAATDLDRVEQVVRVRVRVRAGAEALTNVGPDGLAISGSTASTRHWQVGTVVKTTFIDGATVPLTVRAVYEDNRLLGGALLAAGTWDDHTTQPTARTVFLNAASGVDVGQLRGAIAPVAARFGGEVQDRAGFAEAATGGLDILLGIVYVLLALAIVIALLGIANTLSLAVHERRREIGLLRAVGQTRRQVRAVLRREAVIMSALGTLVGLVLGGFLGWVLFGAISTTGGFTVPVGPLLIVAVFGVAAGALAARRPARRAARLPVLEAMAAV
jgi:putative ABC transport system permease protein